ncbi:MAG: M20 family metallopeptidase [Pseudomonadota bacterium]
MTTITTPPPSTDLTPEETEITTWLAGQHEAMVDLLAEVVNIDSGSYDKAGVDEVGQRFVAFFDGHDMPTEIEQHETYGDAIHVQLDTKPTNEKPILLMGHRDTVFSKGEAGRRPFKIVDGIAHGPGVSDMKAGLVMNAFVLAAFKKFGSNPAPLRGLITSDEEIASPSSRPIIERVARESRCVFNAEPSRPTGAVVTGRKGGVFMRLTVEGKAAHSGGNFEKGISAIGDMAHRIVAIHALTDVPAGITLNVGIVQGGTSVNMTAPTCEARIDMRYVEPEQRVATLDALCQIAEATHIEGATAKLEVLGEFLPLVQSADGEAMFENYQRAAQAVGVSITGEFSGGCADSGFTAGVGCPTLCSMGPVGGNAHTPEEFMDVSSLVPRAQALALAIMRLPTAA